MRLRLGATDSVALAKISRVWATEKAVNVFKALLGILLMSWFFRCNRGPGRQSRVNEAGSQEAPALYPLCSMPNSCKSPHPLFLNEELWKISKPRKRPVLPAPARLFFVTASQCSEYFQPPRIDREGVPDNLKALS